MSSVSRPASSRMLLPRSLFKRIARDASVPAPGVRAAEFMLPRSRTSCVELRPVELAYGTSPRNALRHAFLAIRRAAAAKKSKRIAERLAKIKDRLAATMRPSNRQHKTTGPIGRAPQLHSIKRLQ